MQNVFWSSSETQGQLVGTIECSWWKFYRPDELPLGLRGRILIKSPIACFEAPFLFRYRCELPSDISPSVDKPSEDPLRRCISSGLTSGSLRQQEKKKKDTLIESFQVTNLILDKRCLTKHGENPGDSYSLWITQQSPRVWRLLLRENAYSVHGDWICR